MTVPQPTQPLTDEELEAYAALVDVEIPGTWSRSERNALIAANITAVRRLLPEVQRLRSKVQQLLDEQYDLLSDRDRIRAENTAQAARLAEVARLHQPYPDGGMGWRSEPYPDSDGRYGQIDPCCQVCGTPDEYAAPYPCGTARALGLDQDGRGQ